MNYKYYKLKRITVINYNNKKFENRLKKNLLHNDIKSELNVLNLAKKYEYHKLKRDKLEK